MADWAAIALLFAACVEAVYWLMRSPGSGGSVGAMVQMAYLAITTFGAMLVAGGWFLQRKGPIARRVIGVFCFFSGGSVIGLWTVFFLLDVLR